MRVEDAFIHRLLLKATTNETRTLDLGCGPGRFKTSVRGIYVGLDITAEDYHPGLKRTTDVVASARFLPFKSHSFHLIFAVASFSLFPGPVLCLKDIYRSLRPGGRFVCFEYTWKTLEKFVQPYYDSNIPCHSVWTGRQLAKLFRIAGFQDTKWWVPDTGGGKAKVGHLLSLLYRYFHDYREGWWVVEGKKPASPQ